MTLKSRESFFVFVLVFKSPEYDPLTLIDGSPRVQGLVVVYTC